MQFQFFLFRNFNGDSPLNNLSGYARECGEMAQVYRYAQSRGGPGPRHLVCVDKYGKGTEDFSATALCCATIELFDQVSSSDSFKAAVSVTDQRSGHPEKMLFSFFEKKTDQNVKYIVYWISKTKLLLSRFPPRLGLEASGS